MSYAELLRDPRWQRKRLEVLERAGWECEECCDGAETLHVHHTHYVKGRKPWEYPDEELRCLCATCHADITAIIAKLQRIVGAMGVCDAGKVLGYARAVSALDEIIVDSEDVASGVADYFGLQTEDVTSLASEGIASFVVLLRARSGQMESP